MGLTTWTVGNWTAYMGFPAIPDAYGCTWWATVEEGWRVPPPPRIDRVVRPRRHGEIDQVRAWLPARTMELRGLVEAPDHVSLAAAADRFAALLADGTLSTLSVNEDGVTKQAATRLADSPTFALVHPTLATWILPLLMPDPLRYAADEDSGGPTSVTTGLPASAVGLVVPSVVPWVIDSGGSSGQLTIDNLGTAPTWPEFRIVGPVVNPRIEHATSGRTLTFATTLGPSDTLTIRPETGEVLLNDTANARNALSSGSAAVGSMTFGVGTNEVYYRALSSIGGSTLTVTFRSAYF